MSAELRDYFAARAPAEIPEWFEHQPETVPHILPIYRALEMQPGYAQLSEDDKERARAWLTDGSWDIDNESVATIAGSAGRAIDASREARESAERRNEIARYFAWRWYYADAMLARREQ